jgi:thiol-disulfide isomerase/thioredoxin
MRFKLLFALTLGMTALTLRADENFPLLQAGSQSYTNVTVTKVTATDIFFTHAGGMGNAKLKDLSPDLQQHFHFDPDKAKAAESKYAENQTKYHDALVHQPAARPQDMSRGPAGAPQPAEVLWRSDFPGAMKQALSDNKLVLLDFTGSDWCPWCIKFDKDVLSTSKFATYAEKNLELVRVDFPHHTPLPAEQQHANDVLAKQFGVDGFPTYVLLTATGKEIGRQVGYLDGGPDAFITELGKFSGR